MAVDYQTIKYKAQTERIGKDGAKETMNDLLAKTWSEWKGGDFISPLIINKFYVARPDLIALAVYGDDKYGDMICKFNGISNPFDINEGMIIQIPPITWATQGCEKREHTACELLRDNSSIQPAENTKVFRNEARSSSTPAAGDPPPFIIDRTAGLVIY